MLRIAVTAALIAAALFTIKSEGVLERTGLVGSCTTVETHGEHREELLACRAGKLTGAPGLSRDSCIGEGRSGTVELWRCPAPLEVSTTR